MGRRVPVDLQRFWILFREDAKIGVFFQRLGQVNEIAVGFGDQRGIRQPRTNGLSDIERSRACGNFLHAPVGELHMYVIWHGNIFVFYLTLRPPWFFSIFAQVSFSGTVRLKTSFPGPESRSTQKYPN